ncbi:MAG: HlyD family efflux transporter periplasmic adaptor subunit [Rhodobacter sp.]|nr:HlyD family efflux transporter periplasmic adaptor subunit [Rhodobacter sp.]
MTIGANAEIRSKSRSGSPIAKVIAFGSVFALTATLLFGPAAGQEQALAVDTQRLGQTSDDATDTYFGTVRASTISGLSYAARGCIVEISEPAKRQRVAEAGQVLVKLDDQRPQLALRTAEARLLDLAATVEERQLALAAARADDRRRKQELDFVAEEFERNSIMLGRGLINETTMDTVERRFMDARFASERAKEAIANAEAAVKRAEIALEIGKLDKQTAELNLADVELIAPFDGTLVGFEANVGDCVQEGELAAQIYVPDAKAVDVFFLISRLSERRPDAVSIGASVTVTRVNGEICGGTITRIDTEADLENQFVEATVDVDAACAPALFLNEAVEVETVNGAAAGSYMIPTSAILGENAVFLVDEDAGRLIAAKAEVVERGAEMATVRIANAKGRLIVTSADATMRGGLPVNIRGLE